MKKSNNSFDQDWWTNFLKQSKNMSKPAIFSDCMTTELTTSLRRNILQILQLLSKLRTTKYGFRVYGDDGNLFDEAQMQNIFDHSPIEIDTIESWWKRVFGEKKVGMILNQGERLNLALSDSIANMIKPLIDQAGIPTDGIVFTLFIGNYDSTPLGIHLDLPGKNVIHFHLGPGSKTMYVWNDTKAYVDVAGTGSQNNKDIDRFLPMATKYDFKEGDVFTMPEDHYHIGTQSGLSIGIACWYNNRSKRDFMEQLLDGLSKKYLVKVDNVYLRNPSDNLKPDKNTLNDASFLGKFVPETLRLPEGYYNLSFLQLLEEEYKDHRFALSSNAGYRTSPLPLVDDSRIQDVIKSTQTISVYSPYKILYRDSLDGKKIYIYIRGAKFEFNNISFVKQLVDKLNQGERIETSDILAMLDPNWNESVAYLVLEIFYKHHGIKVG